MGSCTANARRPTVDSRCRGTTINCCVADLRRWLTVVCFYVLIVDVDDKINKLNKLQRSAKNLPIITRVVYSRRHSGTFL